MTVMRPFFTYYGGKWRLARRYPAPTHDVIVEPFAGSAGYSVRYNARTVRLLDTNEVIVGTWQYLIAASSDEIMRLPLLEHGQSVDDLDLPQEARWLIGWWCNKGSTSPKKSLSAWAREPRYARQFWSERVRERIAAQVHHINHWTAECADYREQADIRATWFVDPPYSSDAGRVYRDGGIDYAALAAWCRSRSGQVIVCEHTGAAWLPFEHLHSAHKMIGSHMDTSRSLEAVWLGGGGELALSLPSGCS